HVELAKSERLRRYLPDTALYGGPRDLERFLPAYRTGSLKPVGGSLGLGIVRVQRTPAGFAAAHQPGETLLVHRAASVRALGRIVPRLTRRGPYIIQQGLPLARWRGRPFDVRILMQDRKSTRLNSSHVKISYAVFCVKIQKSHYDE